MFSASRVRVRRLQACLPHLLIQSRHKLDLWVARASGYSCLLSPPPARFCVVYIGLDGNDTVAERKKMVEGFVEVMTCLVLSGKRNKVTLRNADLG